MTWRFLIALVEALALLVALTLIPILVGILLVEVAVRGWRGTPRWMKWVTVGAVVLVLVATVATSRGAIAHDNPEDWDWIGKGRVKNEKGELCCGRGVDCKEWKASEIKITPQGYLFPDGVLVPTNKVTPSADEFAHKCFWGNETKCTFYPMGGS